jgi:hypothetical protein
MRSRAVADSTSHCVPFVTAFIADRFISSSQEVEGREDQVLAELRSINDRLTRLEQRSGFTS